MEKTTVKNVLILEGRGERVQENLGDEEDTKSVGCEECAGNVVQVEFAVFSVQNFEFV